MKIRKKKGPEFLNFNVLAPKPPKPNLNTIVVNLSGFTIISDKGRINGGLKIDPKDVSLKTNKVEKKYTIGELQGNRYCCICRDYKSKKHEYSCKHIIAFLSKKDPNFRESFQNSVKK